MKYVLITPAKNEIATIEMTIKSTIAQTLPPIRWIIVSDGSTDGTDELVMKYCARHLWIELARIPERGERHFAGKVEAFNVGYHLVQHIPHDLIGNLDADLSFDKDYFNFLVGKFMENPSLGVGGTPFREGEKSYDFRFSSIDHVSGACQLFRRQCFEDIGGYVPVKEGGIDVIAVLTARMHGWQTRTFTEKDYVHHRKMGTAKNTLLKTRFKGGQKDYALGAHPLWIIFRGIYQMSGKPLLLGGILLISGYLFAMIKRKPRPVSRELIRFRRNDEMRRLRAFVGNLAGGSKLPKQSQDAPL